jgi:hypothetical protein
VINPVIEPAMMKREEYAESSSSHRSRKIPADTPIRNAVTEKGTSEIASFLSSIVHVCHGVFMRFHLCNISDESEPIQYY